MNRDGLKEEWFVLAFEFPTRNGFRLTKVLATTEGEALSAAGEANAIAYPASQVELHLNSTGKEPVSEVSHILALASLGIIV